MLKCSQEGVNARETCTVSNLYDAWKSASSDPDALQISDVEL